MIPEEARMVFRAALAAILAGMIFIATGCPPNKPATAPKTPGTASSRTQSPASPDIEYPVALSARPYKEVSESVNRAWFLVETSYFVIGSQWREAEKLLDSGDPAKIKQGQDLKAQLTNDIDRKIFGTNDKVEALFKSAIQAHPDNPLNLASYAFYLRSRKRIEPNSDNYKNTEKDALELMDKAIELWPDEWSFYMMKASILNEPLFCDTWFRATAMEELVLEKRIPMIKECCKKAAEYYPKNAYINYYLALVMDKYTDPAKFDETRDEIMNELRAGNAKPEGAFWFFPPLRPIMDYGLKPTLTADLKEAQFTDHWRQCGHLDMTTAAQMVIQLTEKFEWPKDKEDLNTIMEFIYKIGRTKPMDRSLFSLQSQVLLSIVDKLKPGSDDAIKFREVMSFLNAQYHDAAELFFRRNFIKDRTKLDALGIAEAETKNSREPMITQECQGRQAAFLKRAGEILGMDFHLPEDPEKW
jgi:hypothetical protein